MVEARRAIVRSIVDVSTQDDVRSEGKLVVDRGGEVLILPSTRPTTSVLLRVQQWNIVYAP